jgi:pimeloyl-ACP methyl ester carboxylesterase
MTRSTDAAPTIVLVHGAWADGSSWNNVTALLLNRGLRVISAQLPLTSVADDVDAVRRTTHSLAGPIVLVGHSYGGAVISAAAADDARVKALVYIAAIVPGTGGSVGEVFGREPPHPKAPALAPDKYGFIWLPVEAFGEAVAPNATQEERALLAATQKAISVQCLREPLGPVGWRTIPSWFLVATEDRMVSPVTQRALASRMKARVVSAQVDHWPLLSNPSAVADIIGEAL